MDITIKQLKEAAIKKGFKFEIDYPISVLRYQKTYNELTFRFSAENYIWYNFTTIGAEKLEDEEFCFFERYSQNTGKTISSWSQKRKALEILGLLNY